MRSKKHAHKILSLWEKSKDFSRLSFVEKIIFLFLCFLEIFYRLGFFIVSTGKKLLGGFSPSLLHELKHARVISVGNLSVGGTGKSVVISHLYKHLQQKPSAIVLRGYGRLARDEKNVLVAPESCKRECRKRLVSRIGDEAAMFVKTISAPVVVGSDRVASIKTLAAFCKKENRIFDYILLDDAYQNYQIKKDFEILLLDARSPFGNGHCLPAGLLREKDLSRADCIILTHANDVAASSLQTTKKMIEQDYEHKKIFCGIHAVSGVFDVYGNRCDVAGKRFFATAGIGSFSGFLNTLEKAGIAVEGVAEFSDHHAYTSDDVASLVEAMNHADSDGIITTEKDWQKIEALDVRGKKFFYVLAIEFQFLSKTESDEFFALLQERIK